MHYDPKIIDDFIKSIEYHGFQDFCDRLLFALYPEEYAPVRAAGRNGDLKNDGYCHRDRIFFQAHATRGESASKTKNKIESDLSGCLQNWEDVRKFVFITNDTLTGDVEIHVDKLRKRFPQVLIETWGNKRLIEVIRKLDIKDIEYVIDRKIIPETSFSESEVVSTKYLITNNFDLIKEFSGNSLDNFPFENPILFENKTLQFLRQLIKGQEYRHAEIQKFIDSDSERYKIQYPEAQVLPSIENECQFFYHKRIPKYGELKAVTSKDRISQFLINNGISEERIAEIFTCYEGECGGEGRFEELYHLRPLYAQFIVFKNISNFPIRLKRFESIFQDGVLHNFGYEGQRIQTSLPEIILEPCQNALFCIGLFLSQFKELEKLHHDIVTTTYIPSQIQQLELGSLKEGQSIEFIGPRFVPMKIFFEAQNRALECDIHEFTFAKVYWVDRHWQCGSCPHLFFIQNGDLKYQGEILSIGPNQIHKEIFSIPEFVTEIVVAELEREVTLLSYVRRNESIVENGIILKHGQIYVLSVASNDRIEIEGMYHLNDFSNRTLSKREKYNLIEKFKKEYALSAK